MKQKAVKLRLKTGGEKILTAPFPSMKVDMAHHLTRHFFQNLRQNVSPYFLDPQNVWSAYDLFFQLVALPYSRFGAFLQEEIESLETYYLSEAENDFFRDWAKIHGAHFKSHTQWSLRPYLPIIISPLLLAYSIGSIGLLLIWKKKPRVFIWTGEHWGENNYDPRLGKTYPLLYEKGALVVDFVRHHGHKAKQILRNVFKRKRPAIYYNLVERIADLCLRSLRFHQRPPRFDHLSTLDQFLCLSVYQLRPTVDGSALCAPIWKFIFGHCGASSFVPWFFSSRTSGLIRGAQQAEVKTIGIMHGLSSPKYMGHEFITDYQGPPLGIDVFGVWGKHWFEQYQLHARIYPPGAIQISGPLRPPVAQQTTPLHTGKLRVLFVSEQSLPIEEALPYLKVLLQIENVDIGLKVRSEHDPFFKQLQTTLNLPLPKIESGTLATVMPHYHLVIGSHSTVVLESLLYGLPFVFYATKKWGDFLDMSSLESPYPLYVQGPNSLLQLIETVNWASIPTEFFSQLRQQFFAPNDGAQWLSQQCLSPH